jgi:hypothetical protein
MKWEGKGMKALGHASVVSAIKVALDVIWVLLWIALAIAALVLLAVAGAFLMDFMGYEPNAFSVLLQTLREKGIWFPLLIAEIAAVMIVVHRLRRIFLTLINGDPFVPENAGHLRIIALAIAAYQILAQVTQGVVAMLLTLMDRSVAGGSNIGITPDIALGPWIAVGALLLFAEIFREGAKMRQEQKLTI